MGNIYKTVDLFGNEKILIIENEKKSNKSLFDDYEGFTEKFVQKKTTDDCYTPEPIYKAVLAFVSQNVDLSNSRIVRPFLPNGDFENIEYAANDIVIDNPPFSMISKICRFYIEKGIRFFLFAPHLTLFSSDLKCTAIVCGGDIIYENGANVKTSFLSNLFGDLRVISCHSLYKAFLEINEKNKINLPKYEYPNEVLTVSMVCKFSELGIDFNVKNSDCAHLRGLDSQKENGKGIFGSGFLLAEKAAAEKAAAEKAAAEKAAAEKEFRIVWSISERERKIIKSLGENNEP